MQNTPWPASLGGPGAVLPGIWDVPSAMAAKAAGARALFLSGSALAASLGYPDIGLVSASELVQVTERVAAAAALPLMVDAETGYGPLPSLGRLAVELDRAGASAVMLEDQEFTGQSVGREPGLCPPELMEARIRVVKDASGGRLKILGRSDILGAAWPLDETATRLNRYLAAGADWIMPVFVRSREELRRLGALTPGRTFAIAVKGAGGYVPSRQDVAETGAHAFIIARQNLMIFPKLLEVYAATLGADVTSVMGLEMDRRQFGETMGFARYLKWQ